MAIIMDMPLSQSREKSAKKNDDHGLIGLLAASSTARDGLSGVSGKLGGFVRTTTDGSISVVQRNDVTHDPLMGNKNGDGEILAANPATRRPNMQSKFDDCV